MSPQDTIFRFLHHDCNLEQGRALFSYELQTPNQTYSFTETLHFQPVKITQTNQKALNEVLDMLLLMLGISYWKTTCAQNIELPQTITLSSQQAAFWNTIYTDGLGEFYFKNKIDFRGLVEFPISENKQQTHSFTLSQKDRSLVFFGGGKDSVVSVELMKKSGKQFNLFVVNESGIQKGTAKVTNTQVLEIKRIVDSKLLELNNLPGIYNGHIPISSIWATIGLFAAILYDFRYLIVSNEKSANYGNVEYLGKEVNHQWSKSEEFENMFQTYIHENITPDISYFSLLRPLHEIKIAEIFSHFPQYFPYFSSCNKNFKIVDPLTEKRWCGECPKCLFGFIMLSAFLPKDEVLKIFGSNLYENQQLVPLLDELTGKASFKPFECVGTPEETLLGLQLAHKRGEYEQDFLMEHAKNELLPIIKNFDTLESSLLAVDSLETLPSSFRNLLSL